MDQEYPFRPRGRHGFDRDDVINYIAQAQQRCNEHLARMEELEAAKNAWYTQAKGMEREKAALVARTRELEEQLERGGAALPVGGEWFQPELTAFQESQELAAVRARCLELEDRLEQQNIRDAQREQAIANALEAAAAARQEAEALRAQSAEDDGLPRFSLQQQETAALQQENAALQQQAAALRQETDDVRAQLGQQYQALADATQAWEAQAASLEREKDALEQQLALARQENYAQAQRLATLESEHSAYAAQMPALQEQLAGLSESAGQIGALEASKASLQQEKDALQEEKDALQQDRDALQEEKDTLQLDWDALRQVKDALQLDRDALGQRCAALAQEEALARQKSAALSAEAEDLRTQISELENRPAQPSEEALRSMVLASFNYSNLYVDNNLKTAQFISEATSRNIGRVSDSANSLLDQLDAVSRSFHETTDGIRRDLASFQRELGTIQTGMNRRLGKDRFAALLEENERLRVRLETELLAELSGEEEDASAPLSGGGGAKLPFAEDLPKDYHEYLDG
ncbi:MAG: hypothetical protein FWE98_02135 [Oscillospiraceae bacterium]|nr:hypothetical protein [Oscillospiraceae bacterium]